MPDKALKIGWIGMGRMGFPMAERLLKAGYDVAIWNRTRAKAEPLAAAGGRIVDQAGGGSLPMSTCYSGSCRPALIWTRCISARIG